MLNFNDVLTKLPLNLNEYLHIISRDGVITYPCPNRS